MRTRRRNSFTIYKEVEVDIDFEDIQEYIDDYLGDTTPEDFLKDSVKVFEAFADPGAGNDSPQYAAWQCLDKAKSMLSVLKAGAR